LAVLREGLCDAGRCCRHFSVAACQWLGGDWRELAKSVMTAPNSQAVPPTPKTTGKKKRGGDAGFGVEGTNKTLPVPQPDAEPTAELQGTKSKYIPKIPYKRG
jgi:hypothetical protein